MSKAALEKIKSYSIVVGLPVRNEEESLLGALESIRAAMLACREPSMKLVVCINGCTDQSQEIAENFQKNILDIDIDVVTSAAGLVRAQGEIVHRYPAAIYMFPDADNLIEERSLFYLVQALKENKKTMVAYAKTIPIKETGNKSLFHTIGMLYDSQTMLSKRYYFHGRLFAAREWFFPSDEEILKRAHATSSGELLLKYCKGGILLSADDIYMSSYIMHTHGIDAIVQVPDAHCYSYPVGSFLDWYRVYRRRNIEMEKMYKWFPEWNYLKPYLNRQTDWKKWLSAPLLNKILWLLYLVMKGLFWIALKTELLFLHFAIFQPTNQWCVTKTTKKRIQQKNIFFIDIDGTLTDGTGRPPHYAKLRKTIRIHKQRGMLFGLNTNRPWADAKEIYQALDFNGPIIAEDGSYYKLTSQGPKRCVDDCLDDFHHIIEDGISDFKNSCRGIDFTILRSANKNHLSDTSLGGLVFISAHREYTASIYVRVEGMAHIAYTDRLAAHLRKYILVRTQCGARLTVMPTEGKIIISPACVSRLSTMIFVHQRHFADYKCIIISDHEDIDSSSLRQYQCAAVSNAIEPFKGAADYVSTKPFAQGVEDAIIHYSGERTA